MQKRVTVNMAEKRGRQRVNIVKPDRDIERKKQGNTIWTPGRPAIYVDCVPRDDGDYTIGDDCRSLVNSEGVLYAWEPPAQDIPPTILVQWNYETAGNADDDSGTYQFGSHANVAGGYNKTKALQPGTNSEAVPIPDDSIEYTIEASMADNHKTRGHPVNMHFEWRRNNATLQTVTIVSAEGYGNWNHGIVHSVPPATTTHIKFFQPWAHCLWDAVAVSYGGGTVEDDGESLIPPRLGRVYNQVASRVDGLTYQLCIDAQLILEVRVDGMAIDGWSFDGNQTITMPTTIGSDVEVWVRYVA